jgi:5'-nucleotidase
MKKKILYVDMDGVICDFYKPFLEELTETNPYPHSRVGFFIELEPMKDALESFRILQKYYDVWILTRPSAINIHCYDEKAKWVHKHLGIEVLDKTILCTDKSLLKGHFLVDDMTEHGQLDFEGEHIHFGTDKFKDWQVVTEYLIEKAVSQPKNELWKWMNGRQLGCSYEKFCLWSFRIWKWGFDSYILRYKANTDLPWHLDPIDGKHYRLNIKLKGRAYFLVKGISRKVWHDKFILFRPDLYEHSLIILTPTLKLSFGFAKFK